MNGKGPSAAGALTLTGLAPAPVLAQSLRSTPLAGGTEAIPLAPPLVYLALAIVAAALALAALQRPTRQRCLPVVTMLLTGSLMATQEIRSLAERSFEDPQGESLPIPVRPITGNEGGLLGFERVDFTNASGVALQLSEASLPGRTACFGVANPPDFPGTAPPAEEAPECAEGSTLLDGATCRVDVEALCRLAAAGEVKTLELRGQVVDEPVPNAQLTIAVGDRRFRTTANENGNFVITLYAEDENALVTASATSPEDPLVDFVSLVGTFAQLLAAAGSDGVLTRDESGRVNITNISTAEFILLEASNGGPIEDAAGFQAALSGLSTTRVTELAAVVRLIVDQGEQLPSGFSGLLPFLRDDAAVDSFIAELDDGLLDDTIAAITDPSSNPNLVAPFTSQNLPEGYALLSPTVAPDALSREALLLTLGAPNSGEGEVLPGGSPARDPAMTWALENGSIRVTPLEPPVTELNVVDDSCNRVIQVEESLDELSVTLVQRGDSVDLLRVTERRSQTASSLPPSCLGPDSSTTERIGFYRGYRLPEAIIPYQPSEDYSAIILGHQSPEEGSSSAPFLERSSLHSLAGDGTGVRKDWLPGQPLNDESISWTIEDGSLIVEQSDGTRWRYLRLEEDGVGAEGTAVIAEATDGRSNLRYSRSARVDGSLDFAALDAGGNLEAEWLQFSALETPPAERGPEPWGLSLRMCNQVAGPTGPLTGTGAQGRRESPGSYDGALFSWGVASANGEVIFRRYLDPSTFTPTTFCDTSDTDCQLATERSWLSVARTNYETSKGETRTRVYALERLELRFDPVNPVVSERLAFYDRLDCPAP